MEARKFPCLVRGSQLSPQLQRKVLGSFVYRMTRESIKRWPQAAGIMRRGGYRMPIRSDAEWLRESAFYVTKDGALSRRHHSAQPVWMLKHEGCKR